MVKTFLLVWLAVAVAIGLTAWLLPGVETNGGFGSLLVISAVFGFVNAIIGTIVKLLTLPLTVMTLGLFALVVNALMLLITDWWVDRLDVDGFLTALLATILISLFSTVLQLILIGRHGDEKPDRVRRIAKRTIIFVAALLLTISTVVVWSTRTALNSDRFSTAVGSSLDDERVTVALSTYITEQITTVLDLEGIAANLIPGERDLLAGPLAQAAENFIRTRVAEIVGSDQFVAWFTELVSRAHEAAIHIAKGESGPVINAEDGSVVINVAPAIGAVLTRLGADGLVDRLADMPTLEENPELADVLTRIATALNIQIPADFGQITVMQGDTLDRVQDAFRTFRALVWILVLVSVLLAVGAVLISDDRRKALIDLGIGVIVANAIVWILFARIGAKQTEDRPAAAAIFEVLRDSLLRALAVSALIAAIVVLVQWYRGPRWQTAAVGPADAPDTAATDTAATDAADTSAVPTEPPTRPENAE